MFTKKNGRGSFRSNKRTSFKRNTGLYSNNRSRSRGNASQLFEKYTKLAREASSIGDRILSEYYYQFADHYSRLMVESGIKTQEFDNINDQTDDKNVENHIKTSEINENINIQSDDVDNKLDKSKNLELESIETVSFIAKPAKKKISRTKKKES